MNAILYWFEVLAEFSIVQWFSLLLVLAITVPFILQHYGIPFTPIEPTKEDNT